MAENLRIEVVESMPFAENSYIVWRPGSQHAVVIDPGFQPDLIFAVLDREGLKVQAILNTHGHVDHIAGNAAMKEAFPEAPLYIGAGDAPMLTDAALNLSALGGIPMVSPPADGLLQKGEPLTVAGMTFEIRAIPGHSPGHIVLLWRGTPSLVFGGDVLFAGSVGRTDFPGGSFSALKRGIEAHLWPLPHDTIVYPGHGPATTIGHEKQTNPFVGQGR